MIREEWDTLSPDEQWAEFQKRAVSVPDGSYHVIRWQGRVWKPPVDDQGNPPPLGMIGDMCPVWYDGQWWTCHDIYQQRKRQNGEQP